MELHSISRSGRIAGVKAPAFIERAARVSIRVMTSRIAG